MAATKPLLLIQPHLPGYWWARVVENRVPQDWHVCRVIFVAGALCVERPAGEDEPLPVDKVRGHNWHTEWSGPIMPPGV